MDYKGASVSGSQWQRCKGITINNEWGTTPAITMHEEVVTLVGDKVFREPAGAAYPAFDPNAAIELIDMDTWEPLGVQMTQGQIHLALFSLYIATVTARDAADAAAAEVVPASEQNPVV